MQSEQEPLDSLYIPENLFVKWISASFLMTTVSLLFYHMLRTKSIEIPPWLAGIFSVALILMGVLIMIVSIIPYYERNTRIIKNNPTSRTLHKEELYKIFYTFVGISLATIQMGIAVVIIIGVSRNTKPPIFFNHK